MRAALDLLMLYTSKAGATVFGVLILPQFAHLLGARQFGIVASVFALQSLLLVLDLGMATIVGREFASARSTPEQHLEVWLRSKKVISAFYVFLGLLALLAMAFAPLPLSLVQVFWALLLFYTLTNQNIAQAALLGQHRYLQAGFLQTFGIIFRGVGTLLAIKYVSVDLTTFLMCQALCATVHTVVTDRACHSMLGGVHADPTRTSWHSCMTMASQGRALMVYVMAGAAVMQLDKVIVSSFISPVAMTPYYLAMSLCLTPLSVLAGPVAQYFQPRVIRAVTGDETGAIQFAMRPFVRTLVAATVVPTALLWVGRQPLIAFWLREPTHVLRVSQYCAVLLPGIAIGALGYVPYTVLVAKQDFRFQSVASTVMTIVTLGLTAASAYKGSVMGVCWIYAVYHTLSTAVSWMRCLHLQTEDCGNYATQGIQLTLKTVGIAAVPLVAIGWAALFLSHPTH